MKRIFLPFIGVLALGVTLAWAANNFRQSTSGGTVTTFKSTDTAGVHVPHVNIDTQLSPAANTYTGNVNTQGTKTTYRASTGNNAIDAAGGFFQLQGSASKTIRINKVSVTGTLTTTSNGIIILGKYSTAITGGTNPTAPTVVALDSTNAAGTAVPLVWSAVGTLGTLIGEVAREKNAWTADTLVNRPAVFDFGTSNGQALVLRGTAEFVVIRTSGFTSYAGANWNAWIEWTEE